MKKLLGRVALFMSSVGILCLSSCEKEEVGNVLTFNMTSSSYDVSDLGGVVLLPVTSNVEWEITAVEENEWIETKKIDNEMVAVKLTPNHLDEPREMTITIKQVGGKLYSQMKIVQLKISSPRIEITRENQPITYLSLNGEARTISLVINSNTDWKLSTINSWITTDIISGTVGVTTVNVTVTENSKNPRNGILKFTVKDGATVNFRVAQNSTNSNFDSPTHYFYVTFGTIPTLYAGLQALSHDKPSFFAYERQNTFDPEMFPSHITLSVANGRPNEVQEVMRDYMKKKIVEVRDREPNAIFGLYVDDLRCRIGYDWFVGQGIDSSRVKVTLLSDGTGTYNNFNKIDDAKWDKLKNEIETLDWNGSKNNDTRVLPEFESWDWAFHLSTRPNYRLLMQDFSLLEPLTENIRTKMSDMKVVSTTPFDMLDNLSAARQETFYKMAGFDKAKFSAMFDKSPKKNLVIIGTNGDTKQRSYVEQIYNEYSGEYDVFFKPHPSDVTCGDYETAFVGLKLFPGQMPFEIFVWSLIDKIDLIGGYESTVYLTVPIAKVGFIFDKTSASEMVKPLNLLFKDADIKWIKTN